VRADAEQIKAAAERAARLTRQLLVFSRRQPIQPERLGLNTVVTEIRDMLVSTIGTHISLAVTLDPHLPDVVADRGQVEQVLLNLVLNARDAMPRGGVLDIRTQQADLGESFGRSHPGAMPGRYVELTVADTGTGMSAAVAEHIFEPFFTTKPSDQGTGLGLATVHGAVTQAGGSITVESAEGTGTTFRVYIPAVDARVPAGSDAP
jgi:signal transduction histidine kinase